MALVSFGKITVATAGTPVQVTVNQSTPSARVGIQSITVFALAGNAGANVYLGNSTMVTSTGVGVYAIIPKGSAVSSTIQLAPAGLDASQLYIDVDTNGDKALVSGTQQ